MRFLKNKKLASFTLIEVIVTIAVIGFLSMIVISAYKSSQKRYILENETQTFVANVRRIQSLGLAAQDFACASGKVYGYGIAFSSLLSGTGDLPSYYYVFADCDDNGLYDSVQDKLIETVLINEKIDIYCGSAGESCDNINVSIKPPLAQFTIKKNSGDNLTNLIVKFKSEDLSDIEGYATISNAGYVSGCIGSYNECTQ